MKKYFSKLSILFLLVFSIQGNSNAQTETKIAVAPAIASTPTVATGTWAELTNLAPQQSAGLMLLLTDGRILCQDVQTGETGWEILTPNINGSYLKGTWATTTSNFQEHLFCNSQVLPNGEVMVAGGEYGDGDTAGEIYNPVTGVWTRTEAVYDKDNIYDGNSEILPNGTILSGPQAATGDDNSEDCLYYTPSTNKWATAPKAPLNHDEAQWLKLPDSSILFIGLQTKKSCRFRPQTNTWINDANVPVSISDTVGAECGPGVLLPNGNAIFFGGFIYNAIYTPSGGVANGSWVAGPDFPKIGTSYVGITDGPGAMMVNGHVLLSVSPIGYGSSVTEADEFLNPAYFMEYDYVTNTLVRVTSVIPGIGADSISSNTCSNMTFLDLPDGTVLVDESQNGTASLNKQFYIYTPGSAAIAVGKPVINSILPDACPFYKLTGKLFNGISEGTEYGDDLQQSSNYPLVRLTNAGDSVYYCKTTLWNRVGAVRTDSLEDTTVFETPTGLPAGTYSLVVIANGFASSPTIFTTLQTRIGAQENILCNGSNSGTATVSVTGGITPYTYAWTASGGANAEATGLSVGTYTITVHDKNDCVQTATVVITQPTKISATATITANVNCGGNATGAASSTVSGGTLPYTYSWTGGATTPDISDLSAGTYALNVSDNNGCTTTASVTITQPSVIGLSANITGTIYCNGNSDGSISSTVTGGSTPYTYSWTGGATTPNISNLSAGNYSVTVTDKNGCSQTTSVTITEPSTLTTSASVSANTSCSAITGAASSTVSGGTSPYTYSWTGGATTPDISNLSAGTYVLNLSDHNGCTSTASVTITQPSSIGVSATITANVHCNGTSDGSVSSTVSGGNTPYTYAWIGGATTPDISNLSAGTYSVTVTDNSGCSEGASVTITQPNVISASATTTANANCGGSTGSASSSVNGGTSPYTYTWTGGGGNNATATGLTAGNYTVTIKDNCGASSTASIVITAPAALNASASASTNVSCFGDNTGAASSTVSGGATPYTYAWTGGAATSSINGVSAGTYTLVVQDACGNSYTTTTIITGPASALTPNATTTANVACNNTATGSASSATSGGTAPYTYSWTSGSTAPTATGLSAGTYSLTVTDNKGCTQVSTVVVTQPVAMDITTSSVDANLGACNGTASVNVSGGTSPYTYSWNNTTSSTTPTITDQCADPYCCTVTDANGCVQSACVTINTSTTGIATITNASSISIYPDPSTGTFTVAGAMQGQVIEVYNALGQRINSVNADKATMYFNISNQADGIYLVRILTKDGNLVTQKKIIKAQ